MLRPSTAVKLSVRIPPTADADVAIDALERRLTADPPYGVRDGEAGERRGRLARPARAAVAGPRHRPGVDGDLRAGAAVTGRGGTIPFMGMLGRQFPQAQFVITGCWGRSPTPTGPTSSSTCRPFAGSRPRSPTSSTPTPAASEERSQRSVSNLPA